METQIKKLPKSEIEIEAEVSSEVFEKSYGRALKEFNEKTNISGFRSGNIPEKMLLEKISEQVVLERAAELAIQEVYPKIVIDNKIEAVGSPKISIIKIARNNPLGFKALVATLPKITLPDYKKLAREAIDTDEKVEVDEKDITDALEYLRKTKAKMPTPEAENAKKEEGEAPEPELPVLNDDFAKMFEQDNIGSLKELLKQNIQQDKEIKLKEKKRMEALEKISSKTSIEIPDVLIDSEKHKMLGELRASVENMGMQWEDYLKNVKKEERDLAVDWQADAEKRVKYALILREVAGIEKIEPTPEEIESYIDDLLKRNPEHKEHKIDREKMKDYSYGILRNEKVFQFFESKHINKENE